MSVYKQKKNLNGLKKSFLLTTLAITAILPYPVAHTVQYVRTNNYENSHTLFEMEDVDNRLEILGGDERYLKNNYNFYKFSNNNLYNHFNTNHNSNIVVAFDKTFSESTIKECEYVINYFNELFSVINPSYNLQIKQNGTRGNCDILITHDSYINGKKGQTINYFSNVNKSQITSSQITLDNGLDMNGPMLRFVLAHELMHVFLGSPDVDYTKSTTFSVYNYDDITYIISAIKKYEESNPNTSFVTLTPIDVATLCSLYADLDNDEVRQNCIKLLYDTLETCSFYFSDLQPYFEKDFTLPELDAEDENTTFEFK